MNDAAVKHIWATLKDIDFRLWNLENKVEFLRGQVRARLKEEAEARKDEARRAWVRGEL